MRFNYTELEGELRAAIQRRIGKLAAVLGDQAVTGYGRNQGVEMPAMDDFRLIVRAANGQASEDERDETTQAIQDLLENLFSFPLLNEYSVPDAFWRHPIGQAIQQARVWASGDVLLTHREAAELIYGASDIKALVRLSRAVKRGALTQYVEPDEPNPQRAGRISRREAQRLRDI